MLAAMAGTADVTFFAASDTHYGVGPNDAPKTAMVKIMNALPGTDYPQSVGGSVGTPRGVVLMGDLVNDGAATFGTGAALGAAASAPPDVPSHTAKAHLPSVRSIVVFMI